MTYQNNKTLTENSQAGISLMLAILVLAAITAIAFSLATIVLIEIRSASDAFRTEPALYATLGVTEEALFQYKRLYDVPSPSLNVPQCEPGNGSGSGDGGEEPNICLINGVTLTMPGTQPIAYDDSPRVEFLGAGVTKTFPMYLIDDYNPAYDELYIDVLPNETESGVDFQMKFTRPDADEPEYYPGGPDDYDPVNPGTQYSFGAFSVGAQHDLILVNPSSEQDVSVVITTSRVGDPSGPQGLPFVGEEVLRIVADYLGLTRTYQVRIPIP